MSRRIYLILSSVGLSTFILFTLVTTSTSAIAHTVVAKSPFVINTNVKCSPEFLGNWQQTGNGPASFGCGGQAWQVRTPTSSTAHQYDMGTIQNEGVRTFTLSAFITDQATATMNYDIWIGQAQLVKSCVFNQTSAIAWATICAFTFDTGFNQGDSLLIKQWSGAASSRIMSASAIQVF